ncbi:MAG: hypothetical protein DHS20C10_06540 [marine bacterium B5-7]|nr:MAG: hypothetical protein DHS20C10_06540 [marine bacterium B5-7]
MTQTPQPLTMLDVLANSFRLWLQSLPRLFPLTAAVVIICVLFGHAQLAHHIHVHIGQAVYDRPAHWYTLPLIGLLSTWLGASIYVMLDDLRHGRPASMLRSITQAVRKFPIIVIAFVLSAVLTALGFVALVVPGIIMLIVTQFYLPVVMTTDMRWWKAFKYSSDLVWGNWWRTACIFVAPLLVYMLLFSLITALVDISHIAGVAQHLESVHMAILMLVSTVCIPLIFSTVLTQLDDLKARQHLPPSSCDKWLQYVFSFWR